MSEEVPRKGAKVAKTQRYENVCDDSLQVVFLCFATFASLSETDFVSVETEV